MYLQYALLVCPVLHVLSMFYYTFLGRDNLLEIKSDRLIIEVIYRKLLSLCRQLKLLSAYFLYDVIMLKTAIFKLYYF